MTNSLVLGAELSSVVLLSFRVVYDDLEQLVQSHELMCFQCKGFWFHDSLYTDTFQNDHVAFQRVSCRIDSCDSHIDPARIDL